MMGEDRGKERKKRNKIIGKGKDKWKKQGNEQRKNRRIYVQKQRENKFNQGTIGNRKGERQKIQIFVTTMYLYL